MTFEEWIRHRDLSESSVKKYEGAVSGVMSEWAIDGGLMDGPLTSILSLSRFELIAVGLRKRIKGSVTTESHSYLIFTDLIYLFFEKWDCQTGTENVRDQVERRVFVASHVGVG